MKYEIPKPKPLGVIPVVVIGMMLPLFNVIGSLCGDYPFVFGDERTWLFLICHLFAVGPVVALYAIARVFFGRLCYFPLWAGYGSLALFYLTFNIASDNQAGLVMLFLWFISGVTSFIGFIIAVIVHLIIRPKFKNKSV